MHVQKLKNSMAMIKKRNKKSKGAVITVEEARAIGAKTGYSPAGVMRIIRAQSRNPRHRQVMELHAKVRHLRELHQENYLEDLKNL